MSRNERQATLGDTPDADVTTPSDNREISVAEFFEKNKHMLGFGSKSRAIFTAIKEAVDNALDATEEARIHPEVITTVEEVGDYYKLTVEDNGPGITRDQLPRVFGKLLYGSRFHAREQSRGQQGIGISAAVLYSQLTTGTPAKITSRTSPNADAKEFELIIDTDANEPDIKSEKTVEWDKDHGTKIELMVDATMRSRSQIEDYIRLTATVNPHAHIEYHGPKLDMVFADNENVPLPDETEEIQPHPHGVELGTILKMLSDTDSYSLSGFLRDEFTRVGGKTAENILDNFRDRIHGREAAYNPDSVDRDALVDAIESAVRNKDATATEDFADDVATQILDADALTYSSVESIVSDAAESIEDGFTVRFGSTVRENATDAAWSVLTNTRAKTFGVVADDATSTRKDTETMHAFGERLAAKFESAEHDRDRVTEDTLRDYIARSADTTENRDGATLGETARENIFDALWTQFETPDTDVPKVKEVASDRDLASDLLESMNETSVISPPTDCLSPISEELIEEGMRKVFDAEFYAAATRDADAHGGDPVTVEAGIAYGGDIQTDNQTIDLSRFANRVPLVYQQGACEITSVVKDIGWRNYGLSQSGGSGSLPKGDMVLLVHVASTNVPFTSESKDAIASVPTLTQEIERAVRDAARDLKSYLNKQEELQKRRERRNVVGDILPKIAEKTAGMLDKDVPEHRESTAKIVNSAYITSETDGEHATIRVHNYANSETLEPTVEVTTDTNPGDIDLEETTVTENKDGTWTVACEVSVSPDNEATVIVPVDDTHTVTYTDIADEKVTLDAPTPN